MKVKENDLYIQIKDKDGNYTEYKLTSESEKAKAEEFNTFCVYTAKMMSQNYNNRIGFMNEFSHLNACINKLINELEIKADCVYSISYFTNDILGNYFLWYRPYDKESPFYVKSLVIHKAEK